MVRNASTTLHEKIREELLTFTDVKSNYDDLLHLIGDQRIVLIGEASHGTREFYHVRAELTRRLIADRGFTVVAVEADWPDAYRVNRFAKGTSGDESPEQALGDFVRFPTWMWRNTVVRDFVAWLRGHNASIRTGRDKAGFYGLDLYSLHTSIDAVLSYLSQVDPNAARTARDRYACFEQVGSDAQTYGAAAARGVIEPCHREALEQLLDLQKNRAQVMKHDGQLAEDEQFFAEQNARLILRAEEYYRTMFEGRIETWNLRDTHMADTLDALLDHAGGQLGRPAKAIVWAHNSHLGDARATEMSHRGELNLGQLARERHPGETFTLGFTTHTGTVTAAREWDEPGEHRWVRPGMPGSYELLFHEVAMGVMGERLQEGSGIPDFILPMCRNRTLAAQLNQPARLERAIGVIYAPRTERWSHYFHCHLADQFDAVIHLDKTQALEPLEPSEQWHAPELPETFPTGV